MFNQEENTVSIDELKRSFVERGTNLLREIDNTKEDFKTLLGEAKKAGFKTKEIRLLAVENFKNQLGPKLEELEGVKSELDRLFGEY